MSDAIRMDTPVMTARETARQLRMPPATLQQARDVVRAGAQNCWTIAEHRGELTPDGLPLSPVSAAVDERGWVVVSTRETAMKVKHLRRTLGWR